MISIKQNKYLRSLHRKKTRDQLGQYLVEGEKIVVEAILSEAVVNSIYASREWIVRHPEWADSMIIEASDKELKAISQLSTVNQVVAVVEKQPRTAKFKPMKDQWYIGLDGLRDPGNMGTILRTADWFGMHAVLVSDDCVDIHNAKVIQSTMGSVFRVDVQEVNMLDSILEFKKNDIPVYAASLTGEDMYNLKSKTPGLLLFGNESKGLSLDVQNLASHQILIPSFGDAESLNVAISAGIIMAWARSV